MTLEPRERLVAAVDSALDEAFDAWLERWATPAGLCLDAPDPPRRLKTDPAKIAVAVLEVLKEPDSATWSRIEAAGMAYGHTREHTRVLWRGLLREASEDQT